MRCSRLLPMIALLVSTGAVSSNSIIRSARSAPPYGLTTEDLSPNTPNGKRVARASTAGLTLALAGDEKALYTVSLNAGVWKSIRSGPWKQLPNAPARANCIAVDPTNDRHLAVGERNGLAVDMRLNDAGVWETWDAGGHWRYTLDPLSIPGCPSQAIPAVAFSRKGTLFVATAAGIGRKPSQVSAFDVSTSPPGTGLVTAISVSQSKVWARTRTALLVSADDGLSWTVKAIPSQIGGRRYGFLSRGDAFSLAAFDTRAFLVCKPDPDTTGNRNTLLLYDLAAESWQVQQLDSGDGTGLGGRRFVKSYVLANAALKDEIGSRLQLFYGAGQEVHQALGLQPDGTVRWDQPVTTNWGGPYARPPDSIHPDMWDFYIPPDYAPPKRASAWIACDGGVYKADLPAKRPTDFAGRIHQMQWATQNDGLHTHHIHTLTVLPSHPPAITHLPIYPFTHLPTPTALPSGVAPGAVYLAYPTADNDGWFGTIPAPQVEAGKRSAVCWRAEEELGDASWTAGDAAGPAVFLIERNMRLAVLGACAAPPEGAHFGDLEAITLNNDLRCDGPRAFQLIQTLPGETPAPLLDAVLLAQLPLQTLDDQGHLAPVPGALGRLPTRAGPVLLRNPQFLAGPDANRSRFQGWRIEAEDLPAGARGFWVAGGHTHPVYFVYAQEGRRLALYRRREGGDWQRLGADLDLLDGGQYGPAWIDPYDPQRLFALTRAGVQISTDGGATFRLDPVLTALLTDSGKYPLMAGEVGGNRRDVVLASRGTALGTLADVAFDPERPERVIAASAFTGLFLSEDEGRTWRSLSLALPHPLPTLSAVCAAGDSIYVATEGRGLLRLSRLTHAPLASYFDLPNPTRGYAYPFPASFATPPLPWERVGDWEGVSDSSAAVPLSSSLPERSRFPDGKNVATLRNGAREVLAGVPVRVRLTAIGRAPGYAAVVKTDVKGELAVPGRLPPGRYVCRLRFDGTAAAAPCETAFMLDIPAVRRHRRRHGETIKTMIPRGYLCYRASGPIIIDGKLDDPAWQNAPWTEDFMDIEGDSKPGPRFRTRAKMLWDDDYLYVGAEIEEPHVWATLTQHDSVIFQDNDFEVFIDPDGDSHLYYEIEINALNTEWDLLLVKPYRDGGPAVNGWEIPGLMTAVHVDGTLNNSSDTDKGWSVEFAFPWKAMKECAHRPCPPHDGDQWRINFSRVEWEANVVDGRYQKVPGRAEDNWVWSPQGLINMHFPEKWGYVQFCTAPSGQAVFHPDPAIPARDLLYRIYYAERSYHKQHHHWASTLADLGLDHQLHDGRIGPPRLETTEAGFLASVTLNLPDGARQRWHIRDDSRIWDE